MSLADALHWAEEMNPSTPKTLWIDPAQDTPSIVEQDPDVTYRQVSKTVLVKIEKASFDTPSYVALAKYVRTDYGDGLVPSYKWQIEHHTGNWDKKVVGWYPIPDLGE